MHKRHPALLGSRKLPHLRASNVHTHCKSTVLLLRMRFRSRSVRTPPTNPAVSPVNEELRPFAFRHAFRRINSHDFRAEHTGCRRIQSPHRPAVFMRNNVVTLPTAAHRTIVRTNRGIVVVSAGERNLVHDAVTREIICSSVYCPDRKCAMNMPLFLNARRSKDRDVPRR